ncbi:MAG: hypothetical protein QOK15_1449, partial [Nocardioidaceae bacterium]|nr:hypothetical protein [Nocardioidaceae bacterium]
MTVGIDEPGATVVTVVHEPVSGVDVGVAVVASAVSGPIIGTVVLTRGLLRRVVARAYPVMDVLVLHPPVLPRRAQPGSVLVRLSRRGMNERAALRHDVGALLDSMVPRVADELVRRLDVEALVAGLDLTQLAQLVLAEVDLPELIRESTSAVSSETVREVRMRSISGDEAVSRL